LEIQNLIFQCGFQASAYCSSWSKGRALIHKSVLLDVSLVGEIVVGIEFLCNKMCCDSFCVHTERSIK
jgi:hypothetical protein